MTASATNRSAASANRFADRAANFFAGLTGALGLWNDARVTRNSLSRLTDRELDDIGLCRGDIEDIAVKTNARV